MPRSSKTHLAVEIKLANSSFGRWSAVKFSETLNTLRDEIDTRSLVKSACFELFHVKLCVGLVFAGPCHGQTNWKCQSPPNLINNGIWLFVHSFPVFGRCRRDARRGASSPQNCERLLSVTQVVVNENLAPSLLLESVFFSPTSRHSFCLGTLLFPHD